MVGATFGLIGSTKSSLFTTGGIDWSDAGTGYQGVYFAASGTFTILNGVRNIEVFVISGGSGGGGGCNMGTQAQCGGGGGAAGNKTDSTISNAPLGDYTITVGGGGAGGTRLSATPYGYYVAGTGGTGGTSSIAKSGITTISRTGPTGGTGGTALYADPSTGYVYNQFSGGNGASNTFHTGEVGFFDSNSNIRFLGGGGGAGAGGNGSFPNPYYAGGNQGYSGLITGTIAGYGWGGYGGAWSSRYASNQLVGSGGAGGMGADDATYQPGYTGYGGGVYLRWLI